MKLLNSLILLFIVNFCFGQIYQPIAFPEKVDKKYVFNSLKEKEKYDKKLTGKLSKKYRNEFSYVSVFGKTDMFTDGEVYLSWPAMETYINQILDSIMPSNLISKKIHAYIGRSSNINAFCLYDGTMIVNVGLIAEVKNEAALATIMGHELGHFIKNHLLNDFKNKIKNKKVGLEQDIKNMQHSQDNENEADNQGFGIVKNVGYDLNEGYSNFELFIREKEYYEKRNKSSLTNFDTVTISTKAGKYKANTLEKLLSTHPDMKDRKEKLTAYIKSNPQTKKLKNKMDEDLFITLQKQARLECINLIFNENNYSECLERAFIYHLFNPNDINYSYFVAECTRRLCLIDYKLKKKGFLAEKLTNDGFKEGQSILHDLKFLIPNSERYSKISAKELLNSSSYAFESYKDAFYYFTNKLINDNYQEAYLMRALFENNKTKIQENITKYNASGKALHKEYATNYLNNKLTESINSNTKEIIMIPKVYFLRNGYVNVSAMTQADGIYYSKTEIIGTELANEFANSFNSQLQDVKTISLPLAATESFNTKYKYQKVLNSSILARRDENEGYTVEHYYKELEDEDYTGKLDLFRLDPNIWEFFNENKINTISYANYTRHVSASAKKLRNLYFILSVPCAVCFLPLAAFTPVNYKKLSLYSYNSKLGAMYYDTDIQSRKINQKKALKMFKRTKKERDKFIKEYNEKY
ncbi:MAG: M48 family metallopeptidase [Bacteroidota bacterium]|nr:M48 family metallopeptidase [Bacteroidota bacterium]